jgi:ATP synthase protein I
VRDEKRHPFKAMALMSGILSQLAGSALVGLFGGKWIDGYFQTFPLFMVIGLLTGIAAGIYGTILLVNKFFGEES